MPLVYVDDSAPKRKCFMRSKVAGVFTSGMTAALIRESFPNQQGVVVSETAPVPKNLFDMSLEEILSDVEWESTVVEILTLAVSLIVEDPVEDQGVEPDREKTPVASGSRCLRSSAHGLLKRKPTMKH